MINWKWVFLLSYEVLSNNFHSALYLKMPISSVLKGKSQIDETFSSFNKSLLIGTWLRNAVIRLNRWSRSNKNSSIQGSVYVNKYLYVFFLLAIKLNKEWKDRKISKNPNSIRRKIPFVSSETFIFLTKHPLL